MKTYPFPKETLTLLIALLLAPLAVLHAAAEPKPNIVLILADDLGAGHVGWQNPRVKTPRQRVNGTWTSFWNGRPLQRAA